MKLRNAFTMIELIFVIVILGILAAVAIPRLMATRDDAQITKSVTDIKTSVQDFGSYYASKGHFDTKVSSMSNVKFDKESLSFPSDTLNYLDSIGNKCISITLDDNGTLTLLSLNDESVVCDSVRDLLTRDDMFKSYTFGGSHVRY